MYILFFVFFCQKIICQKVKIREKFENVQLQFLNLLKSVIYLLIDMIENETVSKFSDMHQKMTVI